ncbi:class I SAM-dependent methyltransferase [Steroidobacter sp. S1-65]|uniref:Class I SAM-dependent methyltransferase n=1 Tax=Steroidobacter gossypii TaxID=2805490 RepID=A0ABS1X2W1_9GAMM|nr:class I SAM-dependent methyltransferase [Steroidobacter gossypii]MBM0107563.1 class I SAM-dependent methyltransferase [Steroidobacter gossypii]
MKLPWAAPLFSWFVLAAVLLTGCASAPTIDPATSTSLDAILAGQHRVREHRARDPFRHPKETLQFFGIRQDMTVVEVWPGAGWYTEILAPLLRDHGQLYAALLDPAAGEYAKNTVETYRGKLQLRPDLYGKVITTTLAAPPARSEIAPPGSADLVLTFRNLHNWMMFGWEKDALAAMHAALKDGGVLGVVAHRGDPAIPQDPKAASGYVREDYAISMIEAAGFRLVGRSEINANPKDTKNYEQGVWALPPNFAGGDEPRYKQIGESDRFTLKFVKVARP